MANLRIDNLSGDTITVFLDEKSQMVEEDGRATFDALEKGSHTLRIHRTRVPFRKIRSMLPFIYHFFRSLLQVRLYAIRPSPTR